MCIYSYGAWPVLPGSLPASIGKVGFADFASKCRHSAPPSMVLRSRRSHTRTVCNSMCIVGFSVGRMKAWIKSRQQKRHYQPMYFFGPSSSQASHGGPWGPDRRTDGRRAHNLLLSVLPLTTFLMSCYHQAHIVNLNEIRNILLCSTYFKAGLTLIYNICCI